TTMLTRYGGSIPRRDGSSCTACEGGTVPRLKVAFFASRSRFSELALRRLAAAHDIVALALPRARGLGGALRRLAGRPDSPLEGLARELKIPIVEASNGEASRMSEGLRARRPDVLCMVIYPHRLPREVIEIAPLGAINAHPSLLPRHRGPLPIFWTYHADDRYAGVTIHHASERLD